MATLETMKGVCIAKRIDSGFGICFLLFACFQFWAGKRRRLIRGAWEVATKSRRGLLAKPEGAARHFLSVYQGCILGPNF